MTRSFLYRSLVCMDARACTGRAAFCERANLRYYADKEKIREAVNDWIRHGGEFDGVIDFDALARDPGRPTHILAKYDSGDHLHPQDDGYKAMAESIDLKPLTAKP